MRASIVPALGTNQGQQDRGTVARITTAEAFLAKSGSDEVEPRP